jgi:endoglucanase
VSFGTTAYRKWVQLYDGRYFALEGTQDTRNLWLQRDSMVNAGSSKAYFSYETLGGGTHCCWNSMYDPSATNWRSVAPITNLSLAINTYHPNSMGNYVGGSIFQWMLRQGDTSIVGTTSTSQLVANAGTSQTITSPTSSVTLNGSGSLGIIASYSWSFVSGPNTPTIVSPNAVSTSVTGLIPGTYVFSLKVTTALLLTATAQVTVTVNAASSSSPPSGKTIPGTIQAENYDNMSGIKTQTTTDTDGGLNVGWIDSGDWMDYNVSVASAGTYTASFRTAVPGTGAILQLKASNGTVLATVALKPTYGYQVWQTVSASVTLPAGSQTLRIYSNSSVSWNFNWMSFAGPTTTTTATTTGKQLLSEANSDTVAGLTSSFVMYPNPVKDQLQMEINNSHTGNMLIQMISQTGVVLRSYNINKDQPYSRATLPVSNLSAGVYFIRVQIGNWVEIRKLLKL